jgi:pyruvate dehydrogenase E2 component (dihydrolipoamide acetyltransferase)
MADKVLMPKQGNSVESCIIVAWLKKEGDAVAVGEIICEVETDKATIEVESSFEGTLLKTFYEEDDDVPVHNLIALIGEPGEDISEYSVNSESPSSDDNELPAEAGVEIKVESSPAVSAPVIAAEGKRAGSPRSMNLAAAKGIDIKTVTGTGPGGRVIERDILALTKEYPSLSPAAIEELLKSGRPFPVKGSGIGGRVLLSDVQNAPVTVAAASPDSFVKGSFPGNTTEIKVRGIRKVTAEHMFNSISTTAQLTFNCTADATGLLALRKKLKNSQENLGLQSITLNDLVLFAVAKTLPDFPEMNGHFLGDRIVQYEKVHLGCAVDTPKGLLVPVIKDAGSYSLRDLSNKGKELFGAALAGKSNPDDLKGGTFTVTNLGSLGIDAFSPILNKPEIGILGVCTINLKPVERGGEVKFIPHLGLSFTYDHQAVDGAPVALFLKALVSSIENIELLPAI